MAWTLIASVSGNTGDNITGNGGVATSGINTTGANLIVIGVAHYRDASGGAVGDPTDSKGNAWTLIGSYSLAGVNYAKVSMFYCYNPVVGSGHTFLVSGENNYASLAIEAWNGSAASPYDVSNGNLAASTTATSQTTGSITPSQAGELVITTIALGAASGLSIDSGFTIQQSILTNTQSFNIGLAHLIQTSAAAVNPTWSWTGGTRSAAQIASFKVASLPATTKNLAALGVG